MLTPDVSCMVGGMPEIMDATTIAAAFSNAVSAHADRPFLAVPANQDRPYLPSGFEMSYGEAGRRVEALAELYRRAGYGVGHRIATLLENRPEHVLHTLALNTIGVCCVPINPDYRAAEVVPEIGFGAERSDDNDWLGLSITVELQNFYNNFRLGLVTGGAAADVAIVVKVRNAAGTLIYSQAYDASTTNDVFMASGTNAKESLQKALTITTRKIVDDKALQAALLATRTPPAPARAGVRS